MTTVQQSEEKNKQTKNVRILLFHANFIRGTIHKRLPCNIGTAAPAILVLFRLKWNIASAFAGPLWRGLLFEGCPQETIHKGPSIKDVRKIWPFFDPLCPHMLAAPPPSVQFISVVTRNAVCSFFYYKPLLKQ